MLSPTLEELSDTLEPDPRNQRRSTSEPVSPRASFRNLKSSVPRRDGSMTCFPKLLSRSSTSDWLTPLGIFEESSLTQYRATMRATMSDLYARGVDAHSGANVSKPLEMLEESPRQTPAPVEYFPFTVSESEWSRKLSEAPEAWDKKTGRALGAASHRRKSTFKPTEARSSEPRHGILDTLRRYSFMPLSDQTPESIREVSPIPETQAEVSLQAEGGRKRSSKEMLQGIINGKPVSNKPSRKSSRVSSGSNVQGQRRETGSWTTQKRQSGPAGRVSCSEDQTPHVCVDELLTPLSGSEVAYFD
ncbi:hypothetical protein F4820DRAFT_464872 [Hypoxylon rubiginosum]|uniref:Uncharacterized protein n=1 Tax=Hypoxylon rubiginosum TaxID=110542 RepID=A0ACB9YPH2_9PEZI|nr:hypothetical protein F4820DRAFT_464872 [Hypoxylon rubiginosum]